MTALILVGGLGKRLRSMVSDRPKSMALVAGKPFLEYLVHQLRQQGCYDIVLATGYLSNLVREHFQDGSTFKVRIRYSRETEPLGTAGAVKLAQPLLAEGDFIVANGDSLLGVNVRQLVARHSEKKALATLALTTVGSAGRYGTVEVDPDGSITAFQEKTGKSEPGIINGGVYVFSPKLLDLIPAGRSVSLETEVLPGLAGKGIYGMVSRAYFIDIGLPADYNRVQSDPQQLLRAAEGM
jgi:D-glycero-alpha-D-manno-heptose 1-phosphate guanylyltransferase